MNRTVAGIFALTLLTLASPARAQQARPLSYARDVKAILAHHCYECHGNGKTKGGLSLSSRELLLKGGKHGPAAVVGKAEQSALIGRITSGDPDELMPPEGARLSADQIAILRRWIDEGLAWDEITPAKLAKAAPNLPPRRPALPPGDGAPVDRLLSVYFAKNNIHLGPIIDDRTFARRVYLDLVGLPPTPAELSEFLADARPDKRSRLAAALLGDDQRYADHWITFWQDHLRDGKIDLGTTDVFRPITPWLFKSLKSNLPFDQFARRLIDPPVPEEFAVFDAKTPDQDDAKLVEKEPKITDEDSFGFIQGLRGGLEKPRGDQRWQVQAVQNISQVFLGVNLKCATCHDSFIDHWTMKETWGLASVYSEKPLEVVRCETPQGIYPQASFLFPEIGQIDAAAPVAQRRKQLAELVTSPKNGRFARTVVNRLWARLMGRGMIDPVDDMDAAPFDADLLEYLASELVDGGYDLKKIIAAIVSSRAYQSQAIDPGKSDGKQFTGPLLRRMTGEQFVDSLNALQGRGGRVWHQNGGRLLEILGRPDRRTITTARDGKSSPMQALELLNGSPLFEQIYLDPAPPAPRQTDDAKARKLEAIKPMPNPRLTELAKLGGRELIGQLYLHALSRPPTEKELKLHLEMLGEKPAPENVADFLWILSMLPEYQLIR